MQSLPALPPLLDAGFHCESLEIEGKPALFSFESEHVRVGRFEGTNVVLVQRSTTATTAGIIAMVWRPVLVALDGIDRKQHRLLIDTRAAPGRNDSGFESIFASYRANMMQGWQRSAVLLKTWPGMLQAKRYAKEDSVAAMVFDDATAAVRWSLEP